MLYETLSALQKSAKHREKRRLDRIDSKNKKKTLRGDGPQEMGGVEIKASMQVLEEIKAKAKKEKQRQLLLFSVLFIVVLVIGVIVMN